MAYLMALLIFVVLKSACWFVSVSLLRGTMAGPDPAGQTTDRTTAVLAVGFATAASFVPFPVGYLLELVVWAVAAFGGLGLNARRAAGLFGYLAAASFLSRLVILGVMDFFRI